MCSLPQPVIQADRMLPPAVLDLAQFVLHGAMHFMQDHGEITLTYFVDTPKQVYMAGIDIDQFTPDEVETAVKSVCDNLKASAVAFITEAWSLPDDLLAQHKIEPKYPRLADYPEAFEVIMLYIESTEGNWLGTAPIQGKGMERSLPTTIKLNKIVNHPGSFAKHLYIPPAPKGVSLH